MAPIDVNNPALPPSPIPPPPPDDDKDRDRDDRDKKPEPFLRVMRESLQKEHEKQRVQQDAATQVSRERSEQQERVNERADRERGDARSLDDDAKSDRSVVSGKKAGQRAAPSGENTGSGKGRSSNAESLRPNPGEKQGAKAQPGAAPTAKAKDGDGASGDRERDVDALDPERVEIVKETATKADREPGGAGFQARLLEQGLAAPSDAPLVVPNSVVRQAIEFAQFSERGGLLEFSLGLSGNVLGGAMLTIQSLGQRKVAIKLVNGRGGKPLEREDLDDLVNRMRERGIDVTVVEVTGGAK